MEEKKKLSNSVGKEISILIIVIVVMVAIVFAVIYVRNKIKIQNVDVENENENYEVLSDGTKVNNSSDIERAEFIDKGLRVSGFRITGFGESTTINGVVENTTDEKVTNITLKVRLCDSDNVVVYEYLLVIPEIEGKSSQQVQTNIAGNFVNVARIEATIEEEAI